MNDTYIIKQFLNLQVKSIEYNTNHYTSVLSSSEVEEYRKEYAKYKLHSIYNINNIFNKLLNSINDEVTKNVLYLHYFENKNRLYISQYLSLDYLKVREIILKGIDEMTKTEEYQELKKYIY